ncbi:MAG TPA: carbonate dehydratase [Parachlamydiaceae bacterium]|nr:carbonate dehydratase [Parachlamydiaceae bacterium]
MKLPLLFDNNKKWAKKNIAKDPLYFLEMAKDQKPNYLWIGCSDSRIPANEVVGLEPGELFVHRNVANLFIHSDLNCLSVLQYAVDYLDIKHIIVCGHYGCGGVGAAMRNNQLGLVDNWLRNIRDVYARSKDELDAISDKTLRYNRLVELNVMAQVQNVSHTTVVQNAWARGQELFVHGWVYELKNGCLRDLDCLVSGIDQVDRVYLTNKGIE